MSKIPKKVPKYIIDFTNKLNRLFSLEYHDRWFDIAKEPYENSACTVMHDIEYQRLRITIYPCFWENTKENQREYLLHEYSHTITTELLSCINSLRAGTLITPQQTKSANEAATSKIKEIIEAFLRKSEPGVIAAWKDFIA